jgi:DNA-binding CsgD family transcriptional regulator/GAF domain-containing protein
MHGDIFATLEAIHAAGLDAALWPRALEAIKHWIGGPIATIEAFDKRTLRHREFLTHGAPPAAQIEYLDHYAALNVRHPAHAMAHIGDVLHDYAILDADAIERSPFYGEFLPRYDVRFFISGIIASSEREFGVVTVQRSARQEHVGNNEIALMRHLLPHISQAFDVARRLKGATAASNALESALDWLADGVALLDADGTVLFANEGFHAIARRDDGLRLRKGGIEFAVSEARERLQSALAAAARLADGDARSTATPDFTVPRRSGGEPYLVSVRPLLGRSHGRQSARAVAIVFVRDPLARGAAAIGTLRGLFGLTEAEAVLAQALQSGTTVNDYARARRLSLNTVYTHLRRLREKTGSNRLPELIHKLNELRLPLRTE